MQTLEEKTWHELECAARSAGGIEVAMVSLPIEKVKALVAGRTRPSAPVEGLELDKEATAENIARHISTSAKSGRIHEPTYNAAKAGALMALECSQSAPVEGLETIGYAHRGTAGLLMEGAVSKAVLVQKPGGDFKHPVVFAEQAEAIIAAKVEQERLRFEGDLDKWMRMIGAVITGYQPEAYALMDLACHELVKLRSEIAAIASQLDCEADGDSILNIIREDKADNEALTARIKELDRCHEGTIDLCNQKTTQIEALETQLDVAKDLISRAQEIIPGKYMNWHNFARAALEASHDPH